MGPPDARLRGHHLLCLLAFTGEGYSDQFIVEFARLATIYRNPNALIEVRVAPDDACQACPHLGPGGCLSPIDGPEQAVQALDAAVLGVLGIEPGTHRAAELHQRLAQVTHDELHATCKACSWYGRTECQQQILAFTQP
jgi:hypothetical protein